MVTPFEVGETLRKGGSWKSAGITVVAAAIGALIDVKVNAGPVVTSAPSNSLLTSGRKNLPTDWHIRIQNGTGGTIFEISGEAVEKAKKLSPAARRNFLYNEVFSPLGQELLKEYRKARGITGNEGSGAAGTISFTEFAGKRFWGHNSTLQYKPNAGSVRGIGWSPEIQQTVKAYYNGRGVFDPPDGTGLFTMGPYQMDPTKIGSYIDKAFSHAESCRWLRGPRRMVRTWPNLS